MTPQKIRVNAVSPGPILTERHREKIAKEALANNISFEAQMKKNTESIPLGTYGALKDVADLVHFLLSDRAVHINGSNIVLDGGESRVY